MKIEEKNNQLKERIEKFAKDNNEPEWFLNYRLNNFQKYLNADFPNFDTLHLKSWGLTKLNEVGIGTKVHKNSQFNSNDFYSLGELKELGIIYDDFFNILKTKPELIKEYFMNRNYTHKLNNIAYLHNAAINHGKVLYIPKHTKLKKPILYDLLIEITNKANCIDHLLVIVDDNSDLELIQNVDIRSNSQNIAYVFMEVITKDDCHVSLQTLDQTDENTKSYIYRRSYVMNYSSVDWNISVMNQTDSVIDLESNLIGDGSSTNTNVIAVTFNDEEVAVNNRINNIGNRSVGNILQRGVLLQDSTLTFNGIGKIELGAKGSDSQQENRILILSENAKGNANPILLIDENDVTAGHAASVGKIDADKMYYLLSRGLTKKMAKKLLIKGFLSSVIQRSSVKNYDQIILELIEEKLDES